MDLLANNLSYPALLLVCVGVFVWLWGIGRCCPKCDRWWGLRGTGERKQMGEDGGAYTEVRCKYCGYMMWEGSKGG